MRDQHAVVLVDDLAGVVHQQLIRADKFQVQEFSELVGESALGVGEAAVGGDQPDHEGNVVEDVFEGGGGPSELVYQLFGAGELGLDLFVKRDVLLLGESVGGVDEGGQEPETLLGLGSEESLLDLLTQLDELVGDLLVREELEDGFGGDEGFVLDLGQL